jgi:uncharacterized protein (TIGR03067 family)
MLVTPLLFAAVAQFADAPKDDVKADLDKIQGTWKIEKGTYGGEDLDADIVSKLVFEFKGDQLLLKGDEEVVKDYAKITLKLDPATKPRSIDFSVGQGNEKGAVVEGIYEINGDELKICAKLGAKERPGEFKSPENSQVALLTLKRQSK